MQVEIKDRYRRGRHIQHDRDRRGLCYVMLHLGLQIPDEVGMWI